MSDDHETIARSASEPAAFAALFDRHAATVHRYAARRLGVQAADDIMSETFLVAFERRSSYEPRSDDARPWLLGIATVLMKQRARREARAWRGMVAALAAEVAPDLVEAADDRADAERMTRRLAAAMRRMPPGDRDALLLYAWGDLDYAGVADALGVPIGTIRSRLNRARRTLRVAAVAPTTEEGHRHGRTDPAAHGA